MRELQFVEPEPVVKRAARPVPGPSLAPRSVAGVLALQRAAGNQSVSGLFAGSAPRRAVMRNWSQPAHPVLPARWTPATPWMGPGGAVIELGWLRKRNGSDGQPLPEPLYQVVNAGDAPLTSPPLPGACVGWQPASVHAAHGLPVPGEWQQPAGGGPRQWDVPTATAAGPPMRWEADVSTGEARYRQTPVAGGALSAWQTHAQWAAAGVRVPRERAPKVGASMTHVPADAGPDPGTYVDGLVAASALAGYRTRSAANRIQVHPEVEFEHLAAGFKSRTADAGERPPAGTDPVRVEEHWNREAALLGGYTEGLGQNRHGHVSAQRGDPVATAIHEGMHVYQDEAYENWATPPLSEA